jgi:hypothetical protein
LEEEIDMFIICSAINDNDVEVLLGGYEPALENITTAAPADEGGYYADSWGHSGISVQRPTMGTTEKEMFVNTEVFANPLAVLWLAL